MVVGKFITIWIKKKILNIVINVVISHIYITIEWRFIAAGMHVYHTIVTLIFVFVKIASHTPVKHQNASNRIKKM